MICVILGGGAGSRLWPLSRELYPKPFIRLPDGQSLIQKSFLCAGLPETEAVFIVTGRELHFQVAREYGLTDIKPDPNYILEPFGRNTGPAVCAAAFKIRAKYGDDATVLVLPADHLIEDRAAFRRAAIRAGELARDDFLVVLGIKPEGAETAFGYIEAEGQKVLRFVEKPDSAAARRYVESGRFWWNAGILCFKVRTFFSEMEKHCPVILRALENCLPRSQESAGLLNLDEDSFSLAPNISIDYALLEKSDKIAVVPCDIGWSDIGSWNQLSSLTPADQNGNHVAGGVETVMVDTGSCDLYGGGRLMATLGVEGLLIVDTPDALLVADKGRAQEVKNIYEGLKDAGHETYKIHRTVHRPWGRYTVLETGPRFKIKKLEINPGSGISLQLHHRRNEHWVVVSGAAEVLCDDRRYLVNTNESTYIRAGQRHQVVNNSLEPLVIIEVQSGDYLGEDDIVRFEAGS